MAKKYAMRFGMIVLTAILVFSLVLNAQAVNQVTVSPNTPNGWMFLDEPLGNGAFGFAAGPATAPLGTGSLMLVTKDNTGRPWWSTPGYVGVALDKIKTLSYQTYVDPTTVSNAVAPSLQFDVDLDVTDDTDTAYKGRLVYEPYNMIEAPNQPVAKGTWQTWNALAGKWYFSGAGTKVTTACTQNTPCLVDDVLAEYPNLGVMYNVGFRAGNNWGVSLSYVDNFTIEVADPEPATTTTTTIYDFEPADNLYVDDDWTGTAIYTDPDGDGPAHLMGIDAFTAIQPAIDAAAPGATISVYSGLYSAGKTAVTYNGNYFQIYVNKAGLTIQGVDEEGLPITSSGEVQAYVMGIEENVPNFGPDVIFVQADNVTITGLAVAPAPGYENKTIEVIGNNVTLRHNLVDANNGIGSAIYLNEESVSGYTIDSNDLLSDITIASGAGMTGDVSTRQITNNLIDTTWYGVGFRGTNANVAWFTKPVGGAVIEGNTFSGSPAGHVYADGEYLEAQFDWETILANNTFDKTVVMRNTDTGELSNNPWAPMGTTIKPNLRRIGSTIQYDLDRATGGETLTASEGVFTENLNFNAAAQGVTLKGAGANSTIIEAAATAPGATVTLAGAGSTIDGISIENDAEATNTMGIAWGYQANDATLRDSKVSGFITGVYLASGVNGANINNNLITGNANGILIEGLLKNSTIEYNDISGNTLEDSYWTGKVNASIRTLVDFSDDTNVIRYNNLVGSARGLDNNGAGSILVEKNWWGSETGPVQDTNVQGLADFTPWLCSGEDSSSDTGFQPASTALCPLTSVTKVLVFTTQPADSIFTRAFTVNPALRVEDENGALVSNFNGDVTITLNSSDPKAALSGTLTVTAVNGLVSFPGLSIDRMGKNFTLTASATDVTSATSEAFDVVGIKTFLPRATK